MRLPGNTSNCYTCRRCCSAPLLRGRPVLLRSSAQWSASPRNASSFSSQPPRQTTPPAPNMSWTGPTSNSKASTSGQPLAGKLSNLVYKESEFVELGEVIAAHGVKGEVKVDVTTDSPNQRFGKKGTKLYLKPPSAKGLLALNQTAAVPPLMELTTSGHKVQILAEGRELWILSFKEIQDRTVAEKLRHHTVVMPCAQREELTDPDEFYAQDLIGSHVFNQADGVYVGKVVELFSGFGTTETLQLNLRPTKQEMDKASIRTLMVPFIKAMVPYVDKQAKRILVSLPDGLLDLCTTKKIRPMDEEQKAAKLKAFTELEEQERARRRLQPVVVTAAAEPAATQDEDTSVVGEGSTTAAEQRRARKDRRPLASSRRQLRLRPSTAGRP